MIATFFAEVDGRDDQVIAAGDAGCGNDAFSRDIPNSPDPIQVRIGSEHGGGSLVRIAGEVRTTDSLFSDNFDVRIVGLHSCFESVIPLLRHEKVGSVIDQPDLAGAIESLRHQVCRGDAVAIIVGRHDADVVPTHFHSRRHVLHEHDFDTGIGSGLVGGCSCGWIGGNRNNNAGFLSHYRFNVGNLFVWFESGVGDGDDLDAHLPKLVSKSLDLRARPSHCRHNA